ncbi:MAG: cytochrome c biogenesis protein ResB, partial [Planctomycetota bacterium]
MSSSRLGRWLWSQYAFVASGRLTVWLLAILVSVLGAYLFVPQQGEVSARALERWVEQKGLVGQLFRALGLTDVLRSAFFSGTCGLMFVNLLLCMLRRIRSTLDLFRFPERAPLASPTWLRREIAAPELAEEHIAELLREHGFRTLVDDGSVYGLRGRFAIAGHWLFHLGLLALLIVGAFVAL